MSDLEADAIDVQELLATVEEVFDVRLTNQDRMRLTTIGALAKAIDNIRQNK